MHAILLAVAAGLCWGVGELFTKSALQTRQIGPLAAIALRSTVALPLLWLAWLAAMRWMNVEAAGDNGAASSLRTIESATLWKIVLGSGVIAGALGMICFYSAINLGEVSRIKPIAFSVAPATAVLLGWLVLREPMSATKFLGVALILLGVVLLTGNGGGHRADAGPALQSQSPSPPPPSTQTRAGL